MTSIWTLLDARKLQEARLSEMAETLGVMNEFNSELTKIDPGLELIRAKPDADTPGLRPGYWHVMRHNPGLAPSLHVIEGDDGTFREPDSGVFEELRALDWWNDRVAKDRRAHQRRVQRAYERQRAREREERNQDATERFRLLQHGPGVSLTDARKWTYKVKK